MKQTSNHNEPMLELDGEFFPIKDLPPEITELLGLFTAWDIEKVSAIREVQKLDAALKSVSQEIATRMALWRAQQVSNGL